MRLAPVDEAPLLVRVRSGGRVDAHGDPNDSCAGLDVRECDSASEVLRVLHGERPVGALLWELPSEFDVARVRRFLSRRSSGAPSLPVLLHLPSGPTHQLGEESQQARRCLTTARGPELWGEVWEFLLFRGAQQERRGRPAQEGARWVDERDGALGSNLPARAKARTRFSREQAALLSLAKQSAGRADDLEEAFATLTRVSAETLGVGRVSVWRFEQDGQLLRCVHMCVDGRSCTPPTATLARADCADYFRALSEERCVAAHDARRDPRTRELSPNYLVPFGIGSLLDAPLWVGGRLEGVVCHEHVGEPRRWSLDERHFAGSIADLVAQALQGRERGELERELRDSRLRLAALLGNLGHVVAYETGGGREFLSSGIEALTGYSSEFFAAERQRFPSLIHPEDRARLESLFRDWHARGEPGVMVNEFRLRHRDGSWRWVEDHTVQVRPEGERVYMSGVLLDVTERHEAARRQQELEREREQGRKLEALSGLAAGVAHDFNNLLTSILGYAILLDRSGEGDERARRAAQVIQAAAESGAALTEKLLGLSREGVRAAEPVDVHALVEEVVANEAGAGERWEIGLALAAPRAVVDGDAGQLRQLLGHLAQNAREAQPDGGRIRFHSSVCELARSERRGGSELSPGPYLRLVVRDDGPGVPAARAGRVFDPFYSTKPRSPGVGLGLSLAHGFAHDHGGSLRLLGGDAHQGASFELCLPLSAAAGVRAEKVRELQPLPPARGHLLVVDDEPLVREVACEMLRELGWSVTTAEGGARALELYRTRECAFDAVLLDLSMPGMDGRECLARLIEFDADARVVLSSGHALDGEARELLRAGARAIVPKPYDMEALASGVARVARSAAG